MPIGLYRPYYDYILLTPGLGAKMLIRAMVCGWSGEEWVAGNSKLQ